jgi:L-aminopeptidase/D-esterase-like protein
MTARRAAIDAIGPTGSHGAITDVAGITVGHWTDPGGATGCTVVLCPPGGARAAAAVRGRATGTRELDSLDPRHLVGHVDAVLLTGGSAFGLAAADGVMTWLRERRRGFPVRGDLVVPIVPAAVIFDLTTAGGSVRWPDPAAGAAACGAASTAVAEGSVGAGAGATVGKALGPGGAMKGGVGTASARAGAIVVGALVVVNAVGDVRDATGAILAGARRGDGSFLDALRYFASGGAPFDAERAASNTTLAVIATNASVDKVGLEALAQASNDALSRRITPFGTAFDGDITFALSTAAATPASPLQVEALAALAVPDAVERAVRLAHGIPGRVPGVADSA